MAVRNVKYEGEVVLNIKPIMTSQKMLESSLASDPQNESSSSQSAYYDYELVIIGFGLP